MPTLPGFENRAGLATPQPQFAGPNAYGGDAADAIFALGGVVEKLQDAADRAEAVRSVAEAQQEFQGIIKERDDTIGDHAQFVDETKKAIQDSYNARLAKATTNKARELIKNNLSDNLIGANVLIDDRGRGKLKDKALGDFSAGRQQIIANSATSNGANLEGAYLMFSDLVGAMGANNFISQKDMPALFEKFTQDLDTERAGQLLITNPKRLEALIAFDASIKPGSSDKKNFPSLSGGELYTWGQRAKEMQREADRDAAKVEAQRLETVNREMLTAIKAPNANLSLLREDVRRRIVAGTLDSKSGEHWIDEIDQMARAKLVASKENNPYEKSDWETLAMVTRGILLEPDKWTQQRVLSYMGRGLSVKDAEKWSNAVGREADPALSQVMDALKFFRDKKSFLSADERTRTDPEALTMNNMRYMEMVEKITQRTGIGPQGRKEDPRKVMEELMVPYYDGEVKSRFNPLRYLPNLSGYTREDEIAARQRMIRNGIKETPEILQKTLEMMRLEKAGRDPGRAGAEAGGIANEPEIDRRSSAEKPRVNNPDGTVSSEKTITVEADGKYFLIPTIVNGIQLSPESALRQWDIGNNKPVGVYGSLEEANREAKARTERLSPEMQEPKKNWTIKDAAVIERDFMQAFNKPLPVSAYGQSSTHNQMGFNHENGMDIAIHPETVEGKFITNYLRNKGIPFLAFNAAVPGQSTGPHIHVGPSSKKVY